MPNEIVITVYIVSIESGGTVLFGDFRNHIGQVKEGHFHNHGRHVRMICYGQDITEGSWVRGELHGLGMMYSYVVVELLEISVNLRWEGIFCRGNKLNELFREGEIQFYEMYNDQVINSNIE